MEKVSSKINKNERIRRSILTGNLWKTVIYITLPLFFYQFINSFYTLVDQIMVAEIGDSSVSAVATIAQIKMLLTSLGLGLAGGGAIVVAKLYGAGHIEEAKKNANTVFILGLFIIGLDIFVFLPFSDVILKICQVPEDLISLSSGYFRLQLVEQAIIVLNNIAISVEKSKGNTKVIFVMNILNMIVKISLSALFVYGFRATDLIYIELSSIIAQSSMLVISLYLLLNKKNIFQISYKYFSLKWENVKTILLMSLPLFLGKFVISLGKVSVNAMCKVYGSLTVGALGVSNNICGLITNCGASFEDSESSIVSQNLGNKNMKRTMKVFIVSMVLMSIWTVFGYLCVRVFFQDQIINLFSTKNTSPDFIKSIKDIFFYDSFSIPALAINSVILGLLYGYGQTFLATIVNILRIVTRISTLFILQTYFPQIGSEAAGISMGISNGIIAIFSICFFIYFILKIRRKGYKGMSFKDKEPVMVEVDGVLVNEEEAENIKNERKTLNANS